MTKMKTAIVTLLAAILLIVICTGAGFTVNAETQTETLPPVQPEETETPENGIDDVAAQFVEYLKSRYGAEYELYYNAIIEQWGSIEGYLLAFGDKLPEEHKTGWDKFVGWLTEYAPVWAAPLAAVLLIIIAVAGKKTFNRIVDRIVNTKLSPVIKELNLQSNATVSLIRAQKALLGNNARFAGNVEELSAAEKELKNE